VPQAHITALVNEYTRGALTGCPFVDEVVYGFTYQDRGRWGQLAHRVNFLARIVGRYDTALCLRISPPMAALVAWLSGARVRVGYDQPGWFGRLLTHNLGPEPDRTSNRLVNLGPVAALGIETSPAYPRIDWLGPLIWQETAALLAAHGIGADTRLAVCQLSSHWGCNEWRSAKWAALCDWLVAEQGFTVAVTGAGEDFERAKYDEVCGLMQHDLVSLLGQTSITQFMAVVGRANLALASDSALTQIALAQQTPAVIMFGIEPIAANGPLPAEVGRLIEPIQHWAGPGRAPTPNPHCRFGESHCHTEFCRENSSVAQTTVDEVRERVARLLRRAQADTGGLQR